MKALEHTRKFKQTNLDVIQPHTVIGCGPDENRLLHCKLRRVFPGTPMDPHGFLLFPSKDAQSYRGSSFNMERGEYVAHKRNQLVKTVDPLVGMES